MCPFKPLSELVLKCDTGINLSESCCGGVEPPLMEIFGRAATSFRGRVTAVAESQTRRGFWETGEDIWRVWACMGPRAFCAWGPASTMLEGSRFFLLYLICWFIIKDYLLTMTLQQLSSLQTHSEHLQLHCKQYKSQHPPNGVLFLE